MPVSVAKIPRTVVFAMAMLAACSGESSRTTSCAMPASGPKVMCSEIDNAPSGAEGAQVEQSCNANNGSFAEGPCDHTGALGGCLLALQGATFSTITWYYPAGSVMTETDVRATCVAQRATFVNP